MVHLVEDNLVTFVDIEIRVALKNKKFILRRNF